MGDIIYGLVPTVYKSIIKYGGIFLLVLGLFLEGGLAVNNEYLDKAKEWNHKIEIAEIQAREATSKIEYIVKDKIVEVEKKQLVYRDRIIKRSTDIDKDCKVSTYTISILNDAARK
ncbi:hypothetical protein M0R04_05100 [Candidatus Dojkabacteria bacterium]|jgi:hypothetical protein|nr:hypothetical protein [Candidatus Dojkabacteria bacterium]